MKNSEIMEDALAVWPGSDTAAELARAVVQGCLHMADGGVTRSPQGSKITVPVEGSRLGDFLAAHHNGLLAHSGQKLLEFLREPLQSPFFVLYPSHTGSISLDLDALQAAGSRPAAEDASRKLVSLSPSACYLKAAIRGMPLTKIWCMSCYRYCNC